MTPIEKYHNALENLPPSGGGGCHQALLGVANLGVFAGLTNQHILEDLRSNVYGGRVVTDTEIIAAIKKARGDHTGGGFKPQPKPKTITSPRYLKKLLARGNGTTVEDLLRASPITIPTEPLAQTEWLIKSLYRRHEYLFAGTQYGTSVLPAEVLLEQIKLYTGIGFPHIIPNPMTGMQALTKDGKLSFRCDAAVADYRFAVVEFDGIPREDQLAFWGTVPLPIATLIDSGGKSIHGWIKVRGVKTPEQWDTHVKIDLYSKRLIPLGVDPACANPSRLSRLVGHQRDGGRMQQLLYLNPDPSPGGIHAR